MSTKDLTAESLVVPPGRLADVKAAGALLAMVAVILLLGPEDSEAVGKYPAMDALPMWLCWVIAAPCLLGVAWCVWRMAMPGRWAIVIDDAGVHDRRKGRSLRWEEIGSVRDWGERIVVRPRDGGDDLALHDDSPVPGTVVVRRMASFALAAGVELEVVEC